MAIAIEIKKSLHPSALLPVLRWAAGTCDDQGAPGIVISGRNAEKGEGAAASVRTLGTDCRFVRADVSNADDCYKLVDEAIKHFGSVNGLVNSAGIADRGTLLDTNPRALGATLQY